MRKEESKDQVDSEYLDMISYNFKYALENNMDKVYMGYFIMDDEHIKELWVKNDEWLVTLDILIECAVEIEEYEYANEFKKIILKENIYHLNWSKKNKLINKYNILYYYWRYIVNYLKFFFY